MTTTYAYDQNGQRILKGSAAYGTSTYPTKYYGTRGTNTTYKNIYAGDTLVATLNKVGSSTGTLSYIYTDHLGSTNVVADASGTPTRVFDYYPYGEERVDTNPSSTKTQQEYIGQIHDDESALNYLNARYQDPGRGQFVSEDPVFWAFGNPNAVKQLTGKGLEEVLMDPQSLNSYSYAGDNPITNKDPKGLWYQDVISRKQSWSSFMGEVNTAAIYLPEVNPAWGTGLDHPVKTGIGVGVLSVPVAEAALSTTVAVTSTNLASGAWFLAGRAVQAAGYTYLTYDAVQNIPSSINAVTTGLASDNLYIQAKSASIVAYNAIPAFAGGEVGGVTDAISLFTLEVNLLNQALSNNGNSSSGDTNYK